MSDTDNKGFERAYQSEEFASYYGAKHDQSLTLKMRAARETRMWQSLLKDLPGDLEILDCPAGAGRFWPFLRPGARRLVAVDTSAEMMASGRKRHGQHLPEECIQAFAQDLPFDDRTFDLVFCSRLLHHFPRKEDRRDILSSFARVSRGHVAFSTWRSGNLKSLLQIRRAQEKGRQSRFFTPLPQIRADAEAAGLDVVRIMHKQRLVSPIVAVLCRVRS